MRHRLTTATLVLSLMLTLAFAFLWWRSCRMYDTVTVHWPMHGIGLRSEAGAFTLTLKLTDLGRPFPKTGWWTNTPESWNYGPNSDSYPSVDPLGEDTGWFRFQDLDDRWQFKTFDLDVNNDWWTSRTLPAGPRPTTPDSYLRFRLPDWFAVAVFAVIACLLTTFRALRFIRRRRRVRAGACRECGYDLRESPRRCPECGALTALPDVAELS